MTPSPNKLYFGDCLTVMREDLEPESVDLIYLDPPFNSKRLYNAYLGGSQFVAFDDTWRWSEAVDDFDDVAGDVKLAPTMEGLRLIHGEGPNLAYLSYMANRLRECRRVLKPTGSLYLHCDPTMSHSLKLVLDGIFGGAFRSEITWRRTNAKGLAFQSYPNNADSLLYYTKGETYAWNRPYIPLSAEYIKKFYRHVEPETGRRYRLGDLTNPNPNRPNLTYEFLGVTRVWRWTLERMQAAYDQGVVVQNKPGSVPSLKRYLDASKGTPVDTIWEDIKPVQPHSKERIGYPTQKPLALLKRIIKASSNKGDVVFDPFCGCGTTIHAAHLLTRQWIGIDVCVNACKVIEKRLKGHFDRIWDNIQFIGFPRTLDHAKTLASMDKFRFEKWAAALVDGMEPNVRQRGDKGLDGRGRLRIRKGKFVNIVSQVKGGGTGPGDVQAFNGARQQAGADMGVFTCFEDRVTPRMRDAAASTERLKSVSGVKLREPIRAVQIYTIEDYFKGRRPRMPQAR